jgi:hypothetical protein
VTDSDLPEFGSLLDSAMAFYGQSVSEFAISVWWQSCQGFELEQVRKALTAHAMDAERGHFAPKPADIIRQLQGTQTDRSLMAWGKLQDASARVGAYQDVVFDDPAIHCAVEDLGGWLTVCRAQLAELSHMERRFCQSYKAYSARHEKEFPAILRGESNMQNMLAGKRCSPPVLIGNPAMARKVLELGGAGKQKTLITSGAAAQRAIAGLLGSDRAAA